MGKLTKCLSGLKSKHTAILGAQWGDEGKGKLVDILAESLFGKYSTITDFEDHFMMEDSPLQYMTEIQDYVTSQRKLIAQDSEIQNAVDSVMDLLNTTVYKLRQFSEE
jgi:hypothetical protein